ncbi:MAG: hypothetical protein HYX47_12780 [Burkholderiales bacterium]|nr:hypothetical protein [Burkholderiales bacterium]
MKIRLMGTADLVSAWKAALEKEYGIQGETYPSRRGQGEVRVYFELDDRQAAAIVGLPAAASAVAAAAPSTAAVVRPGRASRPRRLAR